MSAAEHDAILDLALAAFDALGLTEADAYLEDTLSETVAVCDGTVESVENKASRGVGIRVLREGRAGFAYTSNLAPEGIQAAVERASAGLEHAGADEAHRLPDPESPPDVEGNLDPEAASMPTEAKVDLARRMETAARAEDRRVKRTRQASYQDLVGTVRLARVGGYRYGFRLSRAFGMVDLVAEEGDEIQSGFHVDYAIGASGLDPEAIGGEAARRAVHKLGGRPCATRRASLLLIPEVVDGLLDALSPIFYAQNVLKGKSLPVRAKCARCI